MCLFFFNNISLLYIMAKYAMFLSQPALNIKYYFISSFPAEEQFLAGGFSVEVFCLQDRKVAATYRQ